MTITSNLLFCYQFSLLRNFHCFCGALSRSFGLGCPSEEMGAVSATLKPCHFLHSVVSAFLTYLKSPLPLIHRCIWLGKFWKNPTFCSKFGHYFQKTICAHYQRKTLKDIKRSFSKELLRITLFCWSNVSTTNCFSVPGHYFLGALKSRSQPCKLHNHWQWFPSNAILGQARAHPTLVGFCTKRWQRKVALHSKTTMPAQTLKRSQVS